MPQQPNSRAKGADLILQLLRARYFQLVDNSYSDNKKAFNEALAVAGEHGVSPALSAGLRQLIDSGLPWHDLLPFVDFIESKNAARNAEYRQLALEALGCLEAAGIKCVLLKGAATILESRDDAGWRGVSDIDLLVLPEDIEAAATVLMTSGFHKEVDMDGFDQGLHHHFAPLSKASGKFVELHVRLMQDHSTKLLETNLIFQRAETITRDNHTLLIPCPEHRMIHLIAHAQISNWGYVLRQIMLKDMVDAMELSRRHAIDWVEVRSAFAGIKAEKQLMGFIWAAHKLLGLELPFSQQDLSRGKAWAEKAIAALYQPEEGWRSSARIFGHYLKLYGREPTRLKLAWKTLKDPTRLKQLININRNRLG